MTAFHPPKPRYKANLPELTALAAEISAAGGAVGDLVEAAAAVVAAVGNAAEPESSDCFTEGLLHLEPGEVKRRIQRYGIVVASRDSISGVARDAIDVLAAELAAALRDQSAAVVEQIRPEFDTALAVVLTAADCGITSTTDAASIVEQGNPKMLSAFRALPDAVSTLDAIGRLRDQLTEMCGVGDHRYPFAAYVHGVAGILDLEGAANLDDKTEMRDEVRWHGPVRVPVVVHRTGGKWLALLLAGYTLRLNTGDEADAVVETAQAGDDEAAARVEAGA